MKRFLAVALALVCATSFGATLTPIQLLNPAGSTSGQVIASTGASSAPAWTTVTLSGLGGIVSLTNGGTGANTAADARTNLGLGAVATLSTVPIANGGTGATTQAAALSAILGSSTVPIANGGTGQTSQSAALTALLGSSAVPVTNGGTGVTTAAAELSRIGAAKSGANTDITSLSAPSIGAATATTAANGTNTTQVATTQFVLSNSVTSSSPTITTPNIVGVTSATNASAGSVGEIGAGGNTASISSNTSTSIGSMPITAGDWDVSATGSYSCTGGNVVTIVYFGVSTTSGSLGAVGNYTQLVGTTMGAPTMATPIVRISTATSTTVYATGNIVFSSGTCTLQTVLRARRVR